MNSLYQLPIMGIFITLFGFFMARVIIRKVRFLSSGLVLWAILLILTMLFILKIDFESYRIGANYVSMLLGPSVIALGVSLYENSERLVKQLKPFLVSVAIGGVVGIISVVIVLVMFNVPPLLVKSIAAKSITSPIAIEVTQTINGIPEVTAGIVIFTGILGSVLGPAFVKITGAKSEDAMGVALGVTAHGIGTAKAYEESEIAGVYGGLAMCVNGLLSAVVLPYIVNAIL